MPFPARALKKNIFFDVDIIVEKTNRNVVYRGLYSYRQRVRVITLFPNNFFELFLHSLQKFLKGKSDAYKQLICIMQRVHFQIRVGVFNCQDKDLFRFFDIVVKNKSNVV